MLINLVSIDASWNSYRRPSLDVPSPFNFKPTTLAKTPVLKPVRVPKFSEVRPAMLTVISIIECWAAPGPQIQAQQCVSPDLS